MIGVFLHIGRKSRRKSAHSRIGCNQGLVFRVVTGISQRVAGNNIPVATANTRYVTPLHLGQVIPPENNLPVSFFKFSTLLYRHGIAGCRPCAGEPLRVTRCAGLMRAAVTRKKQGSTRCEQQKFGQSWRYAAALRPVATQPESRRSLEARPGSAPRSCLMAIRSSVWRQGLRPTCFIAKKTRANVTDSALRRAAFSHLKTSFTGLNIAFGTGDFCCQTPISKDTQCSAKF
ncbi:MAG: hypothetical protein ACI92Z_002133 [Paracoccaceae bacterium]|jgi:hypothetical protein